MPGAPSKFFHRFNAKCCIDIKLGQTYAGRCKSNCLKGIIRAKICMAKKDDMRRKVPDGFNKLQIHLFDAKLF